MDAPASLIESLFERVETYGKTTYELTKLKSLETTTVVATSFISRLSVLMVFAMCAMVLTIGVALLIGELLGKTYYGFFIVAGFYLLAGIVMHFFLAKWLKKPISTLIITQALQ